MGQAGLIIKTQPSRKPPPNSMAHFRLESEMLLAGRTVGNGLRRQTERRTRSVRRVAGRYGPVARATPAWSMLLPLARIFHSPFGKRRESPHEKRGANTCECVVEKTRHAGLETCDTAGWEACATTLGCRCVSRRMVARLQRLMAIMASKPRALPWAVLWRPFRPCIRTAMLEEGSHGFSIAGTAQGLRYGRLGSLRYEGMRGFAGFTMKYPG